MDRRGFLFGAGASLIAAPAVVHAGNLMPISAGALVRPPLRAPRPFAIGQEILFEGARYRVTEASPTFTAFERIWDGTVPSVRATLQVNWAAMPT